MKHYLLIYDVVQDYVARRASLRAAHLQHARAAQERGELLLGGALADPVDGAVLLFRAPSPDVAESFAAADPYVAAGLVTRWRVREWTTVVGEQASAPASSEPDAPARAIARVWRGVTEPGRPADAYFAHLTGTVLPSLRRISGHRGARVARREVEGGVEFVVTTSWASMDAIRAFAGERPERAVVEPAARALLKDFEEGVRHYEVVHEGPAPAG
ncbi:MAG TPA: YciI-like protein [Longimicrobiales bacterium]|nr:YciI-like protein [Longimicrobiales bacterium]